MMSILSILAQAPPQPLDKATNLGNQFLALLRFPGFPILVALSFIGLLTKTKAYGAIFGLAFALALASIFVYHPETLNTVGGWFV